jgi:magnesium chelatase subunit I
MEISRQEAWTARGREQVFLPDFIMRAVEQIAFEAREDQRVDRRSGVSQRLPISVLENVVSNAERRRLSTGEKEAVARVSDIYAALPSITGKLELEYEGEQRGAATVARDLVSAAVGRAFEAYMGHIDCSEVIGWFNDGGTLRLGDMDSAEHCLKSLRRVTGLLNAAAQSGLTDKARPEVTVAVCELILEGLYAQKKISRTSERGYAAAKQEPRGYGYESFSRSRRIN